MLCLTEVKHESRNNRLTHILCQQTVANTAASSSSSTVAVSAINDGSSAELLGGQHSAMSPAWPSGSSVAMTNDFSLGQQATGISAASESARFHCPPQNIPVSQTADLQNPSQPFAGYHDGSTQSVQNHTSPSANSLVCCDNAVGLNCCVRLK